MSSIANRLISLASPLLVGSFLALAGCAPASTGDVDSGELVGAAETVGANDDAISGDVAVGSILVATTDVNLRSSPSTSAKILHVVPNGATVELTASAPSNGFYKVKHSGVVGWSFGKYYSVKSSGGNNPPPPPASDARANALARAADAVGYSYWWGHGRFSSTAPTSATKGSCSGSCPSCSHKGQFGGDCSGLAAKVWQVPSTNDVLSDDQHPYSTVDFDKDSSKWSTVSRGSVLPADAMVYNSSGHGHIFVYAKGDGWGSMYAYECKGCADGCVYDLRTASSAYHAIRHY
ncbi:MAG: SH3 domain-containing protein [Byssovorax sp.]